MFEKMYAALTAVMLIVAASVADAGVSQFTAGEQIYRLGQLPSGAPLRAERQNGESIEGVAGACVNCHRRSGLGTSEGTSRVPPITSKYLFVKTGTAPGGPSRSAAAASDAIRSAYDDRSLADAIRKGKGRGGRDLNYLMPRYSLDQSSMLSLIAYLKSLPTTPSPGASETTLDFAAIVTPDADPIARDGMINVLKQFIADKNVFIRGGKRVLHSQGQIDYRVTRQWLLHVWTLQGPPATWEAQLHEYLRSEPVFAMISGIGGAAWAPVHHFCETAQLPCLFPNINLPVVAEQDFYSIYLTKGALLDAELIATRLKTLPLGVTPKRLIQIHAIGDGAEVAAETLRALAPTELESLVRVVKRGDADELAGAIAQARPGDILVLWLGADELKLLPASPPAGVQSVFVSGSLAGLERAPLGAAWRAVSTLSYPVDLPALRALRMTYPLRWFQIQHVPLIAEKVQADTYLACGIVAEALSDVTDNFMRDYLVERIEGMLSRRQLSGYYPHLGLAPGQRFASKGGYMVRFSQATGNAIEPDGEWIVP